MAKQRLVDFRGGINKKISPHMIGDSQGQDAQDLDMSVVRLQGRTETDTQSTGAQGSFWYDSGVSTGRWVSKYVEDDSGTPNQPYVQFATDFAVWNRDLYAALGPGTGSTGVLQIFRDGAVTAQPAAFDPPNAVTIDVTVENNSNTELIAAVPSQLATTQTVTIDVAGSDSNTAEFNYSLAGSANQQPWLSSTYETWTKTGDATTYYRYSGDNLYTRATTSSGSIPVTIGDAIKYSPAYIQDSGNHQENGYYRWYQGSSAYWANGTSSSTKIQARSTNTSSQTQVTTSNYNSYTWSNGDTYSLEGTVEDGHTKYLLNGSTELWANNSTGQFKIRTASTQNVTYNPPFTYTSSSQDNFWQVSTQSNYWLWSYYALFQDSNGVYQFISGQQTNYSSQAAARAVTSHSGTSSQGNSYTVNRGSLGAPYGTVFSNAEAYTLSVTLAQNSYSYSNHTNTYLTYSYTDLYDSYNYYSYTGPKTEQRLIPYVPATPAYYYDDARSVLYIVKQTDADVGDSSPSFSNQWLLNGRDFSISDSGYYFRSVREVSNQYIPSLSQQYELATLNTNQAYIFGTSHSGGAYQHTPQRLKFTITAPTDTNSDPLVCYRLERRDSITTADLCYFVPTSYTTTPAFFSYTPSTKKVEFVANALDSAKTYTVSWVAYQDTKVQVNGTGTALTSGSYEFAGNASPAPFFTLVDGTDTRYAAADFRLSVKVIDSHPTNTALTGTFALTRCFDVFDLKTQDGNGVDLYLSGECDFLEGWPNGLGCGGLDSSGSQGGVPDFLKFIEESNNFFFGVGTASTNANRYGGAVDNKAGSFLFVSDYNNPRNWELDSYVQFDEEITGIHSYPGELIVWTKNGTYRVFGSRPNEMRKVKLATTEGLLANEERSIALVGNYLVWVSQSGICFYDGSRVTNLTRGRFDTLDILNSGSNVHASQVNDQYYVVNGSTELGYMVDFSLEGFPITRIDLNENGTAKPTNTANNTVTTPPAVLVYKANENKLYSRRGVIEGNTGNRLPFSYKSRAFDGGAFGSLKLIKSVTINGTGSGTVQVYIDGVATFTSPVPVSITSSNSSEPKRVFMPASRSNQYGLPVGDTWWVEINWNENGQIDWIDTDYEVLAQ